ncbi:MAG: hypothetical protein ABI870_06060 [Rhodanobacter sp.]
MNAPQPFEVEPPVETSDRRFRRDAIGVTIASLVGLLALLVSAYTAYIQRQQVRAQVWPYLIRAWVDPTGLDQKSSDDTLHKLAIFNKGVGPAIVRSVQVSIDGKPQRTWQGVFDALALSPEKFGFSSLNGNVLSPGETLPVLVFSDQSAATRFRQSMSARGHINICYCSTLGDCWMLADHQPHGGPEVQPITTCPRISPSDTFSD